MLHAAAGAICTHRDVLKPVNSAQCIKQGFSHQVDTQEEYESSYYHDGYITNDGCANDQNTTSCQRQEHASQATVTATPHEKHGISVHKVVLVYVSDSATSPS